MLRFVLADPQQTATAVEPLLRIDHPAGLIQSYVAAICDTEDRALELVELPLLIDAATAAPATQIPHAAMIERHVALRELQARLPERWHSRIASAAVPAIGAGPILLCRKMRTAFVAAGPADAAGEALVAAQGVNAERLATQLKAETNAANTLAAVEFPCAVCAEKRRCYPTTAGGYSFAVDRLLAVHHTAQPLAGSPLGEWRLPEAARILAGVAPSEIANVPVGAPNAFTECRTAQAERITQHGPPGMLTGETDGRDLLETLRLKLRLVVSILEQLSDAWAATGSPHLCWNDETVRVAWRPPGGDAAAHWGFEPILRKVGWQPPCVIDEVRHTTTPYPPLYSDASYLDERAVEAGRYLGEQRTATVFVKTAKKHTDGAAVELLLEDYGVSRELFVPSDCVMLDADGLHTAAAPTGLHDPADGDAVALSGVVRQPGPMVKAGNAIKAVMVRWYPRFGEATDLFAFGMIALEALIATEERNGAMLRTALRQAAVPLHESAAILPIEQRDAAGRRWVAEQASVDTPAALWTRRNLRYRRADRGSASLDGIAPALWHALMTCLLRCVTTIDGFSYCATRAQNVPRLSDGGPPLPLLELRGLLSLIDDELFGRTAARGVLGGRLQGK